MHKDKALILVNYHIDPEFPILTLPWNTREAKKKKCKCAYSFKTGNWRETVGTALKMMTINACIVFSFPKDFHRQARQNQMLARLNISTQTHRRFGVMKTDTPGSDIRAKMLPPCHSLACLGETQLKLGVAVRKATCAMGSHAQHPRQEKHTLLEGPGIPSYEEVGLVMNHIWSTCWLVMCQFTYQLFPRW